MGLKKKVKRSKVTKTRAARQQKKPSAKRGAPRKWTPRRVQPLGASGVARSVLMKQNRPVSDAVRVVKDFMQFVNLNPQLRSRLEIFRAYQNQMLDDGTDESVVANRTATLVHIDLKNPQALIDAIEMKLDLATLKRVKARKGGPKRKPWEELGNLTIVLVASTDARMVAFMTAWWILLVCGCRPCELHAMTLTLTRVSADITFHGRKNDQSSGCKPFKFLFIWSLPPAPWVRTYLEAHGSVPPIGNHQNVASCINTWVKEQGQSFTSTSPRIRMDNILRDLVDVGTMPVHVYEALIGHTIKVSDANYRR